MATYNELRDLFAESPLRNRLEVSVLIKARDVLTVGVPAAAVVWAKDVLTPSLLEAEAKRMLFYLLAGAKNMTLAQIRAIEDDDLQEAVDDAVDMLYP